MIDLKYCNYHCHSMYTNPRISDSAVTREQYAKRAVELGHGILSSMEHGWQGNYYETYKIAKKYGLKPLIGAEAYWVKDRLEKDRTNCHMYIGAMNENGREALNDVLSEANLTGFYAQPRLDIPLILSLPKDDVIVTSACIAGWRYEDADEIMLRLSEHFEKNFYLEVQYHNVESQRALNERILSLHDKYDIPIIMGCDSHYINISDDQVRTDFLYSKGLRYEDEENWLLDYPDGDTAYKRFAEQCVLSHDEITQAIENTNIFLGVEEYDSPIFNDELKLPSLHKDWTQEQKNEEYKRLVWSGWNEYRKDIPEEEWGKYEEEIQKEIQTVIDTNMADYFIIDYEVMKRGKENGGWLTKTGRGSGASYFTNTLLGFSDIDRVSATVHMYPERFMSATRILQSKAIPDIDMNEAPTEPFVRAQAEILGEDHSYPMIAYGTMKASASWKLYAKSQGIPFEVANVISDQIKSYETAVKHADEDEKDSIDIGKYISAEYKPIYDKSSDYLGLVTSWSIAPCSSLIYDGSIRREIGLVKVKDNICCLMDGHWAEECHFLKNDHLKVSVVELIYKAYHRIGREPPKVKELLKMCPPDDPAWGVFENGATLGINQCERDGTRARAMKYKPKNISELAAFVAAIRPGGASFYKKFESREPFSYGVKAFDSLIQTKEFPYSFLLYQEQVMNALNYAGIDMAECYTAIKNIAKKRAEKVLAYKEKFIDGFTNAIIRDEEKSREEADLLANELWKVIEDASGYSFNCVAGDTKVMRDSNGGRYAPTIEEMYKIRHDIDYAKKNGHESLHDKYVRNGYGWALSLFEDGRVKQNRIVDIRPAGVKDVYEVKTSTGKKIECTKEHKLLTPRGEIEVKNLNCGDEIYVCGKYEKNTNTYNIGNFEKNYPQKGQCGFQKNENGASVVYNRSRKQHIDGEDPCEICGIEYSPDTRFELHHKDFNRSNNTPSNYQWLCVSCHKKVHYANGRNKRGSKGYPVETDTIESIRLARKTATYDVEMADPAHNFATSEGLLVSNCSHAYCVALDALYGAWLKAHYPLEFYETFICIQEAKGDKDKINAAKEEAESYFGIKFAPYKFGQDNRSIHADVKSNSMINSIGSIKGYGVTVGRSLYSCGKEKHSYFIDVLKSPDDKGMKEAKYRPLILIDYFSDFGNQRELVEIARVWEFFKHGDAKSVKKALITQPEQQEIISRYSTSTRKDGSEAASYTFIDSDSVIKCMREFEKDILSKSLIDIDLRVKIQNSLDILGYVDVATGREEDRRTLLITDIVEMKDKNNGRVWGYRLGTRSLGSGKTARITIKPLLYTMKPIKKGDLIRVIDLWKNSSGYWYIRDYDLV